MTTLRQSHILGVIFDDGLSFCRSDSGIRARTNRRNSRSVAIARRLDKQLRQPRMSGAAWLLTQSNVPNSDSVELRYALRVGRRRAEEWTRGSAHAPVHASLV